MQSDGNILSASEELRAPSSLSHHTVWKRLFPHSTTQQSLENIDQKKKKDVEWISDLFKASLFRERASFNELRTSQLSNKQTQTLATLVPDEIIYFKNLNNKSIVAFVGVLLFADVSGFTALCEKYNTSGKGGTYRLTATLNAYIGAMVEVIYSHGGDVLKFSGDAFLAIWKVKHDDFIFHMVHKAIVCALYIQQALGSYETDVKVLLKVKLAISAGNMTFSVIGDQLCNHYIICGPPVLDVKTAEHLCSSGDVILSHSAWGHCSSHNYEYELKDPDHVKVTGIVYNPGLNKKENMPRFPPLRVLLEKRQDDLEKNANSFSYSSGIGVHRRSGLKHIMRPSVSEACKLKLGGVLRPFVIPPVLQQVDADQPLEYLTEMRQVTIMFVNLIPFGMRPEMLVQLVDEACTTVYKIVRSSLGCVNKVTLFDKDVSFLIIFGLRGCKHESESQNGLKCAYSVYKSLSSLENVKSVSAGVTTGMVYCGVVGHHLRREYTVIGAPVNKAARLMCAYPERVSCDHTTMLYSKLPGDHFELQKTKALKGIHAVGNIYKYVEDKRLMPHPSHTTIPLLGREDIISMFENILLKFKENVEHHSLLIEGEAQIGKSRLLEELAKRSLKYDFHPISISLTSLHVSIPYFTIYQLFRQILGLSDTATMRDRAECVIERMGYKMLRSELCYLNDVLQVKFPHSTRYLNESIDTRKRTLSKIVQKLIKQHLKKFIFAIDNAQFIDCQSWELLTDLVLSNIILVIATMYNGKRAVSIEAAETFLRSGKVITLQLKGLESKYMALLACYFLKVRAVSPELENLLRKYGGGNPGWCQNFLTSLMQTGSLRIEEIPKNEMKQKLLVIPDIKLLEKRSQDQLVQNTFSIFETRLALSATKSIISPRESRTNKLPPRVHQESKNVPICSVKSRYFIDEDDIPQTIDAMIMAVFDSLTPYEQLLLKCASVLGDIFSRKVLIAVMYRPSLIQTAQAIKQLFEMQVLGCALSNSGGNVKNHIYQIKRTPSLFTYFETVVNCSCPEILNNKLSKDFPKYAFCQVLHFKIPLFRITTHELLPSNQKKDFHARAVSFLENADHKCFACGGENFLSIPFQKNHDQNINQMESSLEKETNEGNDTTSFEDKEEHVDQEPFKESSSHSSEEWENESELYEFFNEKSKIKDFRNCECPYIQYDACQQLVYHCASAGLKLKQIKFLVEQGSISNTIGNSILAVTLLQSAKNLAENEIEARQIRKATQRFNLGRIYMLLGQAHLDLGNLQEAEEYLLTSINKFGEFFPKSKLAAHIFNAWQYSSLMLKTKLPFLFLSRNHDLTSREKASAFSHLANVYMMRQKWLKAETASLLSLNFAQKSNDLCELCGSYSNVMEICHHFGRLKFNKKIEESALVSVKTLFTGSQAKELISLCQLYWATFISRLLRGELESSIKAGFTILKMSERVCNNFIKLTVIPTLVQVLVMTHGLHDAVDLLNVLLFEAQQDIDKSSEIWYYALCLDILLDTGFSVESYETTISYAKQLLKKYNANFSNIILRDKASLQRLMVNMWVWSVRLHKEEECQLWGGIATQNIDITDNDSFSSLLTALRYLEGVLLSTVLEKKARHEHKKFLRFTAISIIKKIEKIADTVNVIQPRYFHLKAYYFSALNQKDKGTDLLKDAWHIAEQQKNALEIGWVTHSFKIWNGIINYMDKDTWEENIENNQGIDWHEYVSQNISHTVYSLPLPLHYM